MKLPEPAATLWRKHHAAIERIANEKHAESRLLIGGGTVLAARWEHRESTDIDVFLPERENLNDARKGGALDLAKATGGTEVFSSDRQVTIELPEGEIDISASGPRLPGLEEPDVVNGRSVTVLASAQILLGKLYRTNQAVTRDAYDLGVAAEAKPRALEIAINAINPEEARVIARNLERWNDRMVAESDKVLSGVPARYEGLRNKLGHAAAEAVRSHRYESVKVRVSQKGIWIETRTKAGRQWSKEYFRTRAQKALIQSGVGAYLNRNSTVGPIRLEKAIEEIRAHGWEGKVFDSVERRPAERLRTALVGRDTEPEPAERREMTAGEQPTR